MHQNAESLKKNKTLKSSRFRWNFEFNIKLKIQISQYKTEIFNFFSPIISDNLKEINQEKKSFSFFSI